MAVIEGKLRVSMRSEIEELHQRLGTIVYATHDEIEAMTMADKSSSCAP
ncbi:hypothetical protein [Rhizobium laguerreae]|nr:hypothetical protein [Rhizobium laguerreae]